jgi:hypothetical protein
MRANLIRRYPPSAVRSPVAPTIARPNEPEPTPAAALARCDLGEAMRIAKRSEMRLFQCDAHLEYARLALGRAATNRRASMSPRRGG